MVFDTLELRGPLLIEDLMEDAQWELLEPIGASWTAQNGWRRNIIVPAGFRTDLASVPRVFRSIIPQLGRQNLPAVLHDYLYVTHTFGSRARCDELFLKALAWAGVGWVKRNAMYAAVRVGGWAPWNKYGRIET